MRDMKYTLRSACRRRRVRAYQGSGDRSREAGTLHPARGTPEGPGHRSRVCDRGRTRRPGRDV